jgi:5-methylcytosine-specific restriction endonuclease McrA
MRWYVSTWIWAFIMAPVIVAGVAAGLPFWPSVITAAAVWLILHPARRRTVTRPPSRPLDRRQAYAQYMHSSCWRAKRRAALLRDGYACRDCGAVNDLHVHHEVYPVVLGTEPLDWLVTLCGHCHRARHALSRRQ